MDLLHVFIHVLSPTDTDTDTDTDTNIHTDINIDADTNSVRMSVMSLIDVTLRTKEIYYTYVHTYYHPQTQTVTQI